MSLQQSLLQFFKQQAPSRCLIAFSGGLDSTVLLHLCYQLQSQVPFSFIVAHANHGLSPNATKWTQHCKELARFYGFDYLDTHLNLQLAPGDSVEEVARNMRYEWLASTMQEGDMLLTGHHQDDQAETFLLQLMRGAGPKGLSAMPLVKSFAKGKHGRPLLTVSRDELKSYADEHCLQWIEDESNTNTKYARNFIRHEVLNLMKIRWPAAECSISKSASLCAESNALLSEVSIEKLTSIQGSRVNTLSIPKLLSFSDAWQRQLLREWICQQGFALPDQKSLKSIQDSVLTSARDRMPVVRWRGVEVRRHLDDLFLLRDNQAVTTEPDVYDWDFSGNLHLAGVGELCVEKQAGTGLKKGVGMVRVCFRQPGQVVSIKGRGRQSLKNLFQEWRIPTWERSLIPLLIQDKELVAAVGHYINPAYQAMSNEEGLKISLMRA